ncbi:MAG: hypothetical protein R6U95_05525, partial [Bacteroidales bacterium]
LSLVGYNKSMSAAMLDFSFSYLAGAKNKALSNRGINIFNSFYSIPTHALQYGLQKSVDK